MASKKSLLFFDTFNLSSRNSMASTVPIWVRTRRRTHILARVPLSTSSSSFRVPERVMSMAGKDRLSANFRSRIPVTGAFEFFEDHLVHTRPGVDQGGGDNRERAAFLDIPRCAEELFGRCKALASTPPVKTLPDDGTTVLARASRDRIQQDHHVALMFDQTFDHHLGDLDMASRGSKVELITSPFTDRSMSVTSSGRSSINKTIK